MNQNRAGLKIGDSVLICAADNFYAFIDGWRGTIQRFQQGFAVVVCERMEDGKSVLKEFFVDPAQCALTIKK
jgi:hypothetical protein